MNLKQYAKNALLGSFAAAFVVTVCWWILNPAADFMAVVRVFAVLWIVSMLGCLLGGS